MSAPANGAWSGWKASRQDWLETFDRYLSGEESEVLDSKYFFDLDLTTIGRNVGITTCRGDLYRKVAAIERRALAKLRGSLSVDGFFREGKPHA